MPKYRVYYRRPHDVDPCRGRVSSDTYKSLAEARFNLIDELIDTMEEGSEPDPLEVAVVRARAADAMPGEEIDVDSVLHWIEEVPDV